MLFLLIVMDPAAPGRATAAEIAANSEPMQTRYSGRVSLDDRARTPADVPVPEMERLLGVALSRGGDFADLYFEHHRTSSLSMEEGIIRTASVGVTCGLGVRVLSG